MSAERLLRTQFHIPRISRNFETATSTCRQTVKVYVLEKAEF